MKYLFTSRSREHLCVFESSRNSLILALSKNTHYPSLVLSNLPANLNEVGLALFDLEELIPLIIPHNYTMQLKKHTCDTWPFLKLTVPLEYFVNYQIQNCLLKYLRPTNTRISFWTLRYLPVCVQCFRKKNLGTRTSFK